MTEPSPPAFTPADVTESNATNYPVQFRAANTGRWNRRLGEHAGLKNFGVNLTRIVPGGQSSARHAHSKQDEFIWVVSGEIVLETDEGAQTLRPGMCAGFPAGGGNAHRLLNRSDADATILVVGDRTPLDEVTYPDIDNHARSGADGKYVHLRKNGSPHEQEPSGSS
jgi:uncharacterized cupin superfamily protein